MTWALLRWSAARGGRTRRGFELYVGGGLGAVPHQAKLFDSFLPEEELLPTAQAISRVFARLGEKKNRARARIKFLVAKLGIDEFRKEVLKEREIMPPDERWTAYLPEVPEFQETAVRPPAALNGHQPPPGFEDWVRTNVYRQRQAGYAVATLTLPLGDLSSWQARELAQIARRFSGENIRTTVEQNMVLRWVSEVDLPELYGELEKIGLGAHGAGTIVDVTACPGTDTCKLGIASSRGLAAELRRRLGAKFFQLDESIKDLRIKISGCFNSCGQHHVADVGFYGTSRTIKGHKVPHFQVVLGGQWADNAGSYGLAMGSAPARNVPEVLERITGRYLEHRSNGESFQEFVRSVGKKDLRAMLQDLLQVPAYEVDSSFYSDWGDPREFSMGDLGTGECAGEVVTLTQFNLASAEQLVFEAQIRLDDRDFAGADDLSYRAMVEAARALVKTEFLDVPGAPGHGRVGIPAPLLRHGTVLRQVRRRQVRQLPVPASPVASAEPHPGHGPSIGGGEPALHRGGSCLLRAHGPGDLGSPLAGMSGWQKLGLKIFLEEPLRAETQEFIPVFHSWIQNQAVDGHLLIDVHDYSHIHRGPGILLVAHEGNFSLDQADDRPGLLYYRKQNLDGNREGCIRDIFRHTLLACSRLESDPVLGRQGPLPYPGDAAAGERSPPYPQQC